MDKVSRKNWVSASYRPAVVVVPYAIGNPLEWDSIDVYRRRVWLRSGAPSAMGTEPSLVALSAQDRFFSALGPYLDQPSVYDVSEHEVRELRDETKWLATDRDLRIRYRFTGPAVTYDANDELGFRRADGSLVDDPRVEFAGMIRTDGDDLVVETGTPLSFQYLVLLHARRSAGEKDFARMGGDAHMAHLKALAAWAERSGDRTPGAWLDLDRLSWLTSRYGGPKAKGALPSLDSEIAKAVEAVDAWATKRPAVRVAPALGIAPSAWGRRDTPCWGRKWASLDAVFAVLGGADVRPPNGADMACVELDGNDGLVARIETYLAGLNVAASVEGRTLYEFGPTLIWTWTRSGTLNVVVGRVGQADLGLADPLMTEGMLPVASLVGLGEGPASAAFEDVDLRALIADVPGFREYAGLALMTAHAEGFTLADLCASYADLIQWPMGDWPRMQRIHDLNEREWVSEGDRPVLGDPWAVTGTAHVRAERANIASVSALNGLGGKPAGRLDVILRKHDYYEFDQGHAALARALVGACRSGATLEDMARAWVASAMPARALEAVEVEHDGPVFSDGRRLTRLGYAA